MCMKLFGDAAKVDSSPAQQSDQAMLQLPVQITYLLGQGPLIIY